MMYKYNKHTIVSVVAIIVLNTSCGNRLVKVSSSASDSGSNDTSGPKKISATQTFSDTASNDTSGPKRKKTVLLRKP